MKLISKFLLAVVVTASVARAHASDSLGVPQPKDQMPLILAHYMPWYTAKPFSNEWGWHWTMNHFDPERIVKGKRQIASRFYPLIGPYDSGDPTVLEYHLLLMKLAGIDGVIVDWYGLTDYRDYAVNHHNTTQLLKQCERLKMKFVICYEDQTIPALVAANRLKAADRISHARQEIDWLGKYWFQSNSYVKIDKDPVLLSFGHAGLSNDEWHQCLQSLPFSVAYFSQNERRRGAMGGFDWPAPNIGVDKIDQFRKLAKKWPRSIPVAFPRFHDIYEVAKTGKSFPRLADNDGRTFRTTLNKALQIKPSIIQLATWNDWGEGTQIEPSVEFGFRDLEYLQKVRRQLQNGFEADAFALRLPQKLLKMRRSQSYSESKLNQIAQLIATLKIAQAQEQLQDAANQN